MSRAIVFDLDGTLVDSAPDLMDAHNYVMQKFGYHQKPLTDIRHLAGRGAANMILSSLKEEDKKFDQNIHKKMTDEFINYYRENISKKSQIIKGVNEFLAWGKSQKINFAICTNKMETLAKKLLKEINLIEFFDYIAGVDTFEYRKPDPRHLTNILEILDIKKEDKLFYEVLGLKDGEEYVFVNRNYQMRPQVLSYNDISNDPSHYGKKVVEMGIYDGFSIFDWCKVLENASEIHMIETSLNYVLETNEMKNKITKNLNLYHRYGSFLEVKHLFKLNWNYR